MKYKRYTKKRYGKKSYGGGKYKYGVRISGHGKHIRKYGVSRGGIRL